MLVRRTASIDDVRNEKLLYKQAHEHDACGMGFVASIDGKKSHKIVQLAIEGVVNLTHRGAVSADSKSGDGAGITIQIPSLLLKNEIASLKNIEDGDIGLAMCFMPNNESELKKAKKIFEHAIRDTSLTFIDWRIVPINQEVLGGTAKELSLIHI